MVSFALKPPNFQLSSYSISCDLCGLTVSKEILIWPLQNHLNVIHIGPWLVFYMLMFFYCLLGLYTNICKITLLFSLSYVKLNSAIQHNFKIPLQACSQVWSTLGWGFWVEAVIFHTHKKFKRTSAKALCHRHFSAHSWCIHFRAENKKGAVTACVCWLAALPRLLSELGCIIIHLGWCLVFQILYRISFPVKYASYAAAEVMKQR